MDAWASPPWGEVPAGDEGRVEAFAGEMPIGENPDIEEEIPLIRPSGTSPPGGEVVGAFCRLLRQGGEVFVTTVVDRNPLRYRLFAGCVNVVGPCPEHPVRR